MKKQKKRKTPGPEPVRLKIEGDWESAVGAALRAPPRAAKKAGKKKAKG